MRQNEIGRFHGNISRILLLAAMLFIVFWPLPAENQVPQEYQVKAAFLKNFALFVEWPEGDLAGSNGPFSICVIGSHPFGNALQALKGTKLRNRPVTVREIRDIHDAGMCHVLFVSASEQARLPEILAATRKKPILTVSDIDHFSRSGGIIGFIIVQDRVRFDVNLTAAERVRLKLSSQLLKLAHEVRQ